MTRKRTTSLRHALQMLTIDEAARELRITTGMVRSRIRSRKLPHVNLTDDGRTIRLIRCDLRTYAMRHRWELQWLQIMSAALAMVPAVGTVR